MENCWSEEEVRGLSDLDTLVYQSRLVGAESDLVIWGGGNTSLKVEGTDFRGRETRTLLVKASGCDMKGAEPRDFPAMRLDDILPLHGLPDMTDEDLVAYLDHCLLKPGSPRPSIETLLHALLSGASVVHTHADAILSLTNTPAPRELLNQVYGDEVAVVPYQRPGFRLSKAVAEAARERPGIRGVALVNHGLVTWGASPKDSYEVHIELVTRAEQFIAQRGTGKPIFGGGGVSPLAADERRRVAAAAAPGLRSALAPPGCGRVLLRFDDCEEVLGFVGSKQARELTEAGAVTPDHLLHTKRTPLLVEVPDPPRVEDVRSVLVDGVNSYREAYTEWYGCHTDGSTEMLDPNPRVVLVPGLGMWVAGRNARALNVASDIYHHTIRVIAGALAVDGYASLSPQDAFDAEYWPQELYKLTLAPLEKELAGRVALITGGAHGIGRAIAQRLAAEGAHMVVTDIDGDGARSLAEELSGEHGQGRALGCGMDVTSEADVAAAFNQLRLTYGGLDILVSNAGIAPVGSIDQLPLEDWRRAMDINATGHFLVAREAVRLMREQGGGGSLVFIGTKNVPSPGADFGAYSASKAAEVQLAKVLAIENGAHGIRCNVVNPDAVFEGSALWSEEVRQQRARAHGIPVDGLEDFYRQRNLLKERITPEDVAEAVLFLASDRSAKTTGAMLPVDSGLRDAFPR